MYGNTDAFDHRFPIRLRNSGIIDVDCRTGVRMFLQFMCD